MFGTSPKRCQDPGCGQLCDLANIESAQIRTPVRYRCTDAVFKTQPVVRILAIGIEVSRNADRPARGLPEPEPEPAARADHSLPVYLKDKLSRVR